MVDLRNLRPGDTIHVREIVDGGNHPHGVWVKRPGGDAYHVPAENIVRVEPALSVGDVLTDVDGETHTVVAVFPNGDIATWWHNSLGYAAASWTRDEYAEWERI